MTAVSRREVLRGALAAGAACAVSPWAGAAWAAAETPRADIRLGLVTYQWGRDLDLPSLLEVCAKGGLLGVELRTTHAHRVEPNLSESERREVRKRFDDSPVKLVGLGSAEDFHSPDAERVKKAIEATKAFLKLSHDVGGSGVKVRPNDLPKDVPHEKTIEQIGRSLNTVGAYAAELGQQVRLEVHGGCARLPVIRQIMDVATHKSVSVCWNCNSQDLEPPGIEHNFNLVKDRLGAVMHVKTLDAKGYPFDQLMKLCLGAAYKGWWLLEAGGNPPADRAAAFQAQKRLFDALLAASRQS
jgi:hypothetical protein